MSTLARLTPNDLKILSLVADGYTTLEIAEQLKRSPHTIKSQKSRIIGKLQASNITEAVYRSVHQIAEFRKDQSGELQTHDNHTSQRSELVL